MDKEKSSLLISSHLDKLERISTFSNVKNELDKVLEQFKSLVEEVGLDVVQTTRSFDLALGGHLIMLHSIILLEAILPRQPLQERNILRIVSALGERNHLKKRHSGKVEFEVQSKALDVLIGFLETGFVSKEGRSTLDRFWGILEKGLATDDLRDPLARLLYIITRKFHVTISRIEYLVQLIEEIPDPSDSIILLLSLFSSFNSQTVLPLPPRLVSSNKSGFFDQTSYTINWMKKLNKFIMIDEASGKENFISSFTDIKLIDELVVPEEDSTCNMSSFVNSLLSKKVDGKSKELKDEKEKLENWDLVLRHGYTNEDGTIHKLNHFITSRLQYEYKNSISAEESESKLASESRSRIEVMLCRIRSLSEVGGELIGEFEPFLQDLLKNWDGETNKEVMFDLIALQKPLAYETLYSNVLKPLLRLAESASKVWLGELLNCFRKLASTWSVRSDWNFKQHGTSQTAFGKLDEGTDYIHSFREFCSQVDEIINVATQSYPDSLAIRSAALGFYETTSTLPLEHSIPILMIPNSPFAYSCLLSTELMSISRMCGIIAKLRKTLSSKLSGLSLNSDDMVRLTLLLNLNLVEFLNALWMKRFLSDAKLSGLSEEEMKEIKEIASARDQTVGGSQGLAIHGAFAHLARECLAVWAKENDIDLSILTAPLTFTTLRDLVSSVSTLPNLTYNDFRIRFVEYLRSRGAIGLDTFVYNSLSSLIDKKKQ